MEAWRKKLIKENEELKSLIEGGEDLEEFMEFIYELLKKDKQPIKIENGVAQIDKTHPDYDFLMED